MQLAGVDSILNIRQGMNRQIKVQTVYSNSRRNASDPTPSPFLRVGVA